MGRANWPGPDPAAGPESSIDVSWDDAVASCNWARKKAETILAATSPSKIESHA